MPSGRVILTHRSPLALGEVGDTKAFSSSSRRAPVLFEAQALGDWACAAVSVPRWSRSGRACGTPPGTRAFSAPTRGTASRAGPGPSSVARGSGGPRSEPERGLIVPLRLAPDSGSPDRDATIRDRGNHAVARHDDPTGRRSRHGDRLIASTTDARASRCQRFAPYWSPPRNTPEREPDTRSGCNREPVVTAAEHHAGARSGTPVLAVRWSRRGSKG